MIKQNLTIGIISAIAIGMAVIFFGFDDDDLPADQQRYTVTSVATPTTTTASAAKTGTYTAAVDYAVPSPEQNTISVTLKLKDNVIEAVSVDNTARNHESEGYEKSFLAVYETEVIGKRISDVSLSRVGGASLTSNAFTTAVGAIAKQS